VGVTRETVAPGAVLSRRGPGTREEVCNELPRIDPNSSLAFNSRGLLQLKIGALGRAIAIRADIAEVYVEYGVK
jgi:hypothetical protein